MGTRVIWRGFVGNYVSRADAGALAARVAGLLLSRLHCCSAAVLLLLASGSAFRHREPRADPRASPSGLTAFAIGLYRPGGVPPHPRDAGQHGAWRAAGLPRRLARQPRARDGRRTGWWGRPDAFWPVKIVIAVDGRAVRRPGCCSWPPFAPISIRASGRDDGTRVSAMAATVAADAQRPSAAFIDALTGVTSGQCDPVPVAAQPGRAGGGDAAVRNAGRDARRARSQPDTPPRASGWRRRRAFWERCPAAGRRRACGRRMGRRPRCLAPWPAFTPGFRQPRRRYRHQPGGSWCSPCR